MSLLSARSEEPVSRACRREPIIDQKLSPPYSGHRADTDEFEEIMRITFGLITSLAWLVLSPFPSAWGANVLSNEWTVSLHGGSDSAPAVGPDGTIYFGTFAGRLWALNPDGSRKWIFRANNEIKSAPAVGADSTVYFGCRDRKVYAVRANGKKRWEFPTGGWVDSSPALATNGTVYFGSWDKRFYALNADGKKQWQFSTPGEIVSSPSIGADGTIYFGSHDKKFYALTAKGHKQWEFATGGPIISSPALNRDQCLYCTSVDGCLYALNLDGSLRWRLRTGGTTESSPVIGPDGSVYVGVWDSLWAVSPDGKKKWARLGEPNYPFDSSPVVLTSGSICCVSTYGMLWHANSEGGLQGMYYLYGYGYGSPAIGLTGAIYIADGGGVAGGGFSALRAGVSLAHSPWPKFRGNPRNTGNLQDTAP